MLKYNIPLLPQALLLRIHATQAILPYPGPPRALAAARGPGANLLSVKDSLLGIFTFDRNAIDSIEQSLFLPKNDNINQDWQNCITQPGFIDLIMEEGFSESSEKYSRWNGFSCHYIIWPPTPEVLTQQHRRSRHPAPAGLSQWLR